MKPSDVEHLATTVILEDGTELILRPIRPSDREQLAAGFDRLSPQSRSMRFFSALSTLNDRQLQYFTDIDYVDHFAWVAGVRAPDDSEYGVGVARYIRTSPGATEAEAAVTVIDDYHRRGIGSILLEALAAVALTNGITTFLLHVRSDNRPMASTMSDLGARSAFSEEAGTLEYRMNLPEVANDVRNTPMWKVFRLVGAGDELVAGPRFDHRRGTHSPDGPARNAPSDEQLSDERPT